MEIKNTKSLKKHNKFIVLNEIIDKKSVSRVELTRNLNVSHATVSYIVKELLKEELILELESSESTGGRPPKVLKFNGKGRYIIALDILKNKLIYSLFNLDLKMLYTDSIYIKNNEARSVIKNFYKKISLLLTKKGIKNTKIIGIGVSIRGIYDDNKDLIIDSVTKNWEGIHIKKLLSEKFKLPIYIENDANLAAYYEWSYGVGKSFANLIYLHIEEGIGGGIIINNKLYRGGHGNAGELGHVKVKESGPKCECGNVGCLEKVASSIAIQKKFNNYIDKGEKSILEEKNNYPFKIEEIINAYNHNDFLARLIINEALEYIVSGLASIINMFDPDLVVLGGDFKLFEKKIVTNIKEKLVKICFENIVNDLKIVTSNKKSESDLELYPLAVYVFDKWKEKI